MYKLLEYVVCTLNFTPVPELGMLGGAIASRTLGGDSLPLRTLIKLVNFDPRYSSMKMHQFPTPHQPTQPPPTHTHSPHTHPPTHTHNQFFTDVSREIGILTGMIGVLKQLLLRPALSVWFYGVLLAFIYSHQRAICTCLAIE